MLRKLFYLLISMVIVCFMGIVVTSNSYALTKKQLDDAVGFFTRYMQASYMQGWLGSDCQIKRNRNYSDFLKQSGDADFAELMSSFSYAYCILGKNDAAAGVERSDKIIKASTPLFYEMMK